MRVVHLNSSFGGGSGKAALRLHYALLNNRSITSDIIYLNQPPSSQHDDSIHFMNKNGSKLKRLLFRIQKFNSQLIYNIRRNKAKEQLSASFSIFSLRDHPLIKSADIIHIHWSIHLIDVHRFLNNIKKPVVITHHDMWYFTGGCHYSDGCKKFMSTCHQCPETSEALLKLNVKREQLLKQKTFTDIKQLGVVCLSNWMFNLSTNSMVFSGKKHKIIRNSINTETFRILDSEKLRQKYQFQKEDLVLFFIASTIDNHRKGLKLLLQALKFLPNNNLTIISAGSFSNNSAILNKHINYGFVKSDQELAELYNIANLCVIPSLEDNLPNTMLESLVCGTPVVSFNIGGMKDIIIDGFNGEKAENTTSKSLSDAIEKLLGNISAYNRQKIHENAVHKFSPNFQADEMIKFYDEVKTQ